ncbi:hypothetical protein PoB_004958100 [Plakobranchus ocellatus]|uniref:Integrase zinc-binding domain-containing protein n=1 Tax=Plakobranchus ocellatus TaxID=259542 RepID=A0AAV4BRH0_9GAST|nr:hypothetical protein PoB_004958100 [Plakobranchus ocellatus]
MFTEVRHFHQYRDGLVGFDGVVLYKDSIIISPSLCEYALQLLYAAHQGVSQMCSRAESSVFWPGKTSAIINLRTRCSPCNRMAPSQPSAPPTPPIQPTYPSQCICADFFTYAGHNDL